MNEKYIQRLIRLVEDSDIDSLEISSWGRKIKIVQRVSASADGHSTEPVVMQHMTSPSVDVPPSSNSTSTSSGNVPKSISEVEGTENLLPIKAPMVGTFYTASAPDADPYVAPNQKIHIGQVVCIVEAMKLMNEIESEVNGRVAKILVQNAEPVEFGQTMFLIEPD
ncbi:MAG: acetyl-CoA carboxylase biotin carboxyl carrier protein [candidate division Zixibacteria bacterium]|nr:acetyl-CoA carboxylase biotin carboxyl carrier protein [candidate division Zixibacteria bacterium]